MKLLILAGGTGTRLWPVSRIYNPKQFVKFKGMGYSAFQSTILNAVKSFNIMDIIIVTNKEYQYFVYGQLKEINIDIPNEHILLEPGFKNTLHAVSYGIYSLNDDDNVLVIPSNNIIDNYNDLISLIERDSSKEKLNLFSVSVNNSLSDYGYIKIDGEYCSIIEKPDIHEGAQLLEQGYLCNSGMIYTYVKVFKSHIKKLYHELDKLFSKNQTAKAYESSVQATIEQGLLEKINNIKAIQTDITWSNVNEFSSFYSQYNDKLDDNGNIYFDESTIFLESENNLIYSENNKAIGCIGINDVVVIDQPDALLVCHKSKTSNVRKIAEKLKAKNDERAELHITAYRPWGSYTVLEEKQNYKIKRLTVNAGKKLSYQMHYHRSEHWVVVSGIAAVVKEGVEHIIKQGESIFISAGEKHRLENRGKILLEVIEVQIGSYLGEDDIVRFEDDYGRQEAK